MQKLCTIIILSSMLFVGDSSSMEKLSNDVSQSCEITAEVMWNFMFADNRDNPQEFIKKNPYIVNAWVKKCSLSYDTYSLLHCAVEHDRVSEVKALLEAGDVHINTATERYKYTPLHMVKSKEMAKLLLDHKADLEIKDNIGQTPLSHVFFNRGRLDYSWHFHVKIKDKQISDQLRVYLLQRGANPNAVDNKGKSLLHHALGCPEHITFLMHFGADAGIKDSNGKTACDYIIDQVSCNKMTLKYLRRSNIIVGAGDFDDGQERRDVKEILNVLSQFNIVFVNDKLLNNIYCRDENEDLQTYKPGNLLELLQDGGQELKKCILENPNSSQLSKVKEMLASLFKMARKNEHSGKIIYYAEKGYLFNKVNMTDLEEWCGKDSVDYLCAYLKI